MSARTILTAMAMLSFLTAQAGAWDSSQNKSPQNLYRKSGEGGKGMQVMSGFDGGQLDKRFGGEEGGRSASAAELAAIRELLAEIRGFLEAIKFMVAALIEKGAPQVGQPGKIDELIEKANKLSTGLADREKDKSGNKKSTDAGSKEFERNAVRGGRP